MAKNSVRDFDATAANNTDIQSVDIAENCAPSGINNAIRELMADIKDVSTGTIALESPQADSLTVTGDLTVDTNTLYVDSTNNRVGVGTSSPSTVSGFTVLEVAGSSNGGFIQVTDGTVNNSFYNSSTVGFIGTQTNHSLGLVTNGSERLRVDSSGGIGGNTVGPRGDIVFTSGTQDSSKRWGFGGALGSGSNTSFYIINEGNIGQYMAHGAQTWTAHSDERIKENITNVGEVLPSLLNMRCIKYNLISNPENTKIGFIAQDWEASFPEVVDEDAHLVLEDDGTIGTDDNSDSETPVKAMSYTETIPLLLKAIQEQQVIIDDLKSRIEALENA